jgi:tRNA-uridine 2-sulfurtransferase
MKANQVPTSVVVGLSGRGQLSRLTGHILEEQGFAVRYLHLKFSSNVEKIMGFSKTSFDPRTWAKESGKDFELLDLSKESEAWLQAQALRCLGQMWVPDLRGVFDSEFMVPQLLNWGRRQGMEAVATGHRARLTKESERDFSLWRSRDVEHDQSSWLAQAGRKYFRHLMLPLGYLKFAELARLAIKYGFSNDENDLIGEERRLLDTSKLLSLLDTKALSLSAAKGYVVDHFQQVYGEHSGLVRFRVGTREGFESLLGVPGDFVAVGSDLIKQWLLVGPSKTLNRTEAFLGSRMEWCTAAPRLFSDTELLDFQVGFEKALMGRARARLMIDSMLRLEKVSDEEPFPFGFGRRLTLYREALCLGSMQVVECVP